MRSSAWAADTVLLPRTEHGDLVSECRERIVREWTYLSGAGQSELKRNPSFAWTMASSRVMASTAPLLAVYASWGVALPIRATTLAVFIILPLVFSCLRRLSTACLLPNQTPLTLIACVRSQIFSGVLMASASLACMIPALLNMMSTPPHESRRSTMAATSDSLETSHLHIWMRGWSGRISSTLASAMARAGSEMSAMRISAPSRAKRMVVSRPMPLTR